MSMWWGLRSDNSKVASVNFMIGNACMDGLANIIYTYLASIHVALTHFHLYSLLCLKLLQSSIDGLSLLRQAPIRKYGNYLRAAIKSFELM